MHRPDRRGLLKGAAALVSAGALAGCDRISDAAWFRRTLQAGEDASLYVQRLLLSPGQLAPEYADKDLSPKFKANGSTDPTDKNYRAMAKRGFSDFRLQVDGLVERPLKFSLADLRKMPARTQITRHDCVEGWSCIGKWTGVPLSEILQRTGLKPQARFVVFHCADVMEGKGAAGSEGEEGGDSENSKQNMSQQSQKGESQGGGQAQGADASGDESDDDDSDESQPVFFYGTIDLTDAYHPQTILAYEMNGAPLPVPHGAPLRLRVERQLGYKMSKYIMRIEVVDDFTKIGDGKGGYWEDRGYDWYAGI